VNPQHNLTATFPNFSQINSAYKTHMLTQAMSKSNSAQFALYKKTAIITASYLLKRRNKTKTMTYRKDADL